MNRRISTDLSTFREGKELEIGFTHVINDSIHHGHVIALDTKAQVSILVGEHINGKHSDI